VSEKKNAFAVMMVVPDCRIQAALDLEFGMKVYMVETGSASAGRSPARQDVSTNVVKRILARSSRLATNGDPDRRTVESTKARPAATVSYEGADVDLTARDAATAPASAPCDPIRFQREPR
jgi:hypothetical protein